MEVSCVVGLVAGSKSVDVYIRVESSDAPCTSGCSSISPYSTQTSSFLSSFFSLYTSVPLLCLLAMDIATVFRFQVTSAQSHSLITQFWHLPFGCDVAYTNL